MLAPLLLSAFTRIERGDATARLRDAFSNAGALLLDVHLFSNIAMSMTFEVPRESLGALTRAIVATGVRLSEESAALLAEAEAALRSEPAATGELAGTLMVTFVHDEPDLEREVPAVPG